VEIRQANLLFSEELTYCDGSNESVIDALSCSVPISVITQYPYSLPWGSEVFAKVIAYNDYGDSLVSEPGSGAIILTVPDKPVDLVEVIT